MKNFSIKESYKEAWGIWKKNRKVLTLMTLFALLIGMVPHPHGTLVEKMLFGALLNLITTFVALGYLKVLLLIEKGEEVEFGDIFKHARYFWRYLFASLLLGLYVGFGIVLLIVPGIYFLLKYVYVLTLILDKDLMIGEAFTQSGVLTRGVKWKLLGFIGTSLVVLILGIIALGVGFLVAMPVVALTQIVIYRKLSHTHHSVEVAA